MSTTIARVTVALAVILPMTTSALDTQAPTTNTIHSCVDANGNVRIAASPTQACPPGWKAVDWAIGGPAGPNGPAGPAGPQGPAGPEGPPGPRLLLPFSGEAKFGGNPVFHSKNLSDKGIGVQGDALFIGVLGKGTGQQGSIGVAGWGGNDAQSTGVDGRSLGSGIGVYGASAEGIGVKGIHGPGDHPTTIGTLGDTVVGVKGTAEVAGGKGVAGKGEGDKSSVGVYGESASGLAGFFRGKVTITDSLLVEHVYAHDVTGARKLFRIDHPLDPAAKYLSHVSVESDEMTDLYSGNVTIGPAGDAWVNLPAWFEALNGDFRYQLTCVGGSAPVYVAQEIHAGRFLIAGGKPGLKVSWQVTGIRHDAYARAHPVHVEEEKAPGERGRYLHPTELGFPEGAVIENVPVKRSVERQTPTMVGRENRPKVIR